MKQCPCGPWRQTIFLTSIFQKVVAYYPEKCYLRETSVLQKLRSLH